MLHPDIEKNAVAQAKAYAAADKSDPFTFSRAMTHIKNGIVGFRDDNGQPAFYNASPETVNKPAPEGYTFSDGSKTFSGTTWNNLKRP